jgi:hypothetical protein
MRKDITLSDVTYKKLSKLLWEPKFSDCATFDEVINLLANQELTTTELQAAQVTHLMKEATR